MSVAYYYDKDLDYVLRRLNGTVLLRAEDGVPVYIMGVQDIYDKATASYKALMMVLSTGEQYEAPLATLNMEAPRVGFVNHGGVAVYAYRRPVRKYHQGLHMEQLTSKERGRDLPPLHNTSWVATYTNTYPSFKEALVKLKEAKTRSVAFARDFAVGYIDKVLVLKYQDDIVGRVQDGVPVLDAKYHFLTEKLQQDLRG